jgi:hypothetical protein
LTELVNTAFSPVDTDMAYFFDGLYLVYRVFGAFVFSSAGSDESGDKLSRAIFLRQALVNHNELRTSSPLETHQ